MPAPVTIHGIKNCDTMKKARAWLDAHGVAHAFHDYKTAGIDRATLAGGEVVGLGAEYAPPTGQVQIGIRPEHAMLTATGGLPFNIRRVEDVGRHRLVRGEVLGHALNVVVPEGMPVEGLPRVAFAPDKINVYADDWRVAPARERAA